MRVYPAPTRIDPTDPRAARSREHLPRSGGDGPVPGSFGPASRPTPPRERGSTRRGLPNAPPPPTPPCPRGSTRRSSTPPPPERLPPAQVPPRARGGSIEALPPSVGTPAMSCTPPPSCGGPIEEAKSSSSTACASHAGLVLLWGPSRAPRVTETRPPQLVTARDARKPAPCDAPRPKARREAASQIRVSGNAWQRPHRAGDARPRVAVRNGGPVNGGREPVPVRHPPRARPRRGSSEPRRAAAGRHSQTQPHWMVQAASSAMSPQAVTVPTQSQVHSTVALQVAASRSVQGVGLPPHVSSAHEQPAAVHAASER